MEYLVVKWLHVLSSTVLFGAGVGSALHMLLSCLRRRVPYIAGSVRNVVVADWLLTMPAAIFQPLSGLWLVHLLGLPLSTPWIAWSLALYGVAIAAWLPVVWLQIRMRDLAVRAESFREDLPGSFWSMFQSWVVLGFVGLFAFVAVFWLMVAKRVPFG